MIDFKSIQPDMSIIPSFASLAEATMYVVEANEIHFNNMMKSIGLHELAVFESTGSVLLYEGEGEDAPEEAKSEETKNVEEKKEDFVAGFFTRAKTIIENFLRKITNFVKGCIAKLQVAFGKKALDKENFDKLAAFLPKMDDSYEISRYPWNGMAQFGALNPNLKSKEPGIFDAIYEELKDATDKNAQDFELIDDLMTVNNGKVDAIRNYFRSENPDLNNIPEKVEKKTIKIKTLKSEEFKVIFDYCTNFKEIESNIKHLYNFTKKHTEEANNSIKGTINKDLMNKIKQLTNLTLTSIGILLSEFYAMIGSNMKIVTTVYKAYNKSSNNSDNKAENKAEENKETTEEKVGESAIDSELSSLFDWSY